MQAEPAANRRGHDRKERALRDGQAGRVPHRRVLVVFRRGRRHDHVVAVVASGQEDADQRPVVGALREGVDQAEARDAGGERGGAERIAQARLARLEQEFSASDRHGYLST